MVEGQHLQGGIVCRLQAIAALIANSAGKLYRPLSQLGGRKEPVAISAAHPFEDDIFFIHTTLSQILQLYRFISIYFFQLCEHLFVYFSTQFPHPPSMQ
jgi:hypothetical protein